MRRRQLVVLIALVVIVFLAVSALLARVWSADGAENTAITTLIRAEARGDQNAMLNDLQGCRRSPACQARVAADVADLKRPGVVTILHFQSSTGFSFGATLGTARVAWRTPSSLSIVQCVRVRRAGNAFRAFHVELLEISTRIRSDADCPAHF
jgi:hypothetical protein